MGGKMSGIYLEDELLRSPAYWSLSKWAILVLQRFMQKRQLVKVKHQKKSASYRIANNGQIVFTYREALVLGIDERAFRNALDELIAKGFLDITRYGKGGRSGDSTLYFIDSRWKEYSTDRFLPPKKPRIKNTRQGQGWPVYNAKQKLIPTDKNNSATTDKNDRRSGKNEKKRLAKMTVVKNTEIATTSLMCRKKTQIDSFSWTSGNFDSILKNTRLYGKAEPWSFALEIDL